MEYSPGFLFFNHFAAVKAPSEYNALSKDSWFRVTISFPLENLTSCSPITSPFLIELKLIFFDYGKDLLCKYFFPIKLCNFLCLPSAIPFPNINAVPDG